MRALWWIALAACSGRTGTIDLSLVTAPGSTVLDGVERMRVTITNPLTVVEAPRTESGFDLALDVEAIGGAAQLIVEGFDANGALLATGASPPFAVSAIDAAIVIYVARPHSIAPAPHSLAVARAGVASTKLTYGLAIAGGEDTAGVKTNTLFVYNVFDHSLLAGKEMPAPRSFQTIATAGNDSVLLFGGLDGNDAPTGTLWRFDTTVRPNGSYQELGEQTTLARAGETALALTTELHLITGAPPVDVTFNSAVARTDVASVAKNAVIVTSGGVATSAVFGGNPARVLEGGTFRDLGVAFDPEDSATAIEGQAIFASARGDTELALVDPAGPVSFVDRLTTLRKDPAIAATDRFLVVAGGRDAADQPIGTADVISLERPDLPLVITLPCIPRFGATAHAMPNGQIVIVGGEPASDTIELYTPPSPL